MIVFDDFGVLNRLLEGESLSAVIDEFESSHGWREGLDWFEKSDDGSLKSPSDDVDLFAEAQFSVSRISQVAFDLIIFFEVTSEEVYDAKYRKPIWPGEQSGVTIGIGYDVGYVSKARLWSDWMGVIPDQMITALESAIGIKGPAAKQVAKALKNKVDVPFQAAINVHASKVLPLWFTIVDDHLDNTELLSPDSFGALVSLTYNRGPSFSKPGDRYAEMRAVKAHMKSRRFDRIPAEFRSMKRLWPNSPGLRKRREAEAILFEKGLESSLARADQVSPSTDAPSAVILKVDVAALNFGKFRRPVKATPQSSRFWRKTSC